MNSTPVNSKHLGPRAQIGGYVCPGPNPSADQRDGSGAGEYGERTGDCCEFRLHHFRYPRSFGQFEQAVTLAAKVIAPRQATTRREKRRH